MNDPIYERNGKKYTRQQLEQKYGSKVDDAINQFGFAELSTPKEKERLNNPVQEYEYAGKKFTREQLQQKYGDKTDAAIAKLRLKDVSPTQEVNSDLGASPEQQRAESPVKKKEPSDVVFQDPALASSGDTEVTSTSSVTEEVSWTTDLANQFKSGAATSAAGIAGIKNYLTKTIASVMMDDEDKEVVNSFTPEVREVLLNSIFGGNASDQAFGKWSIETQNKLTEVSEKYREKTQKFEGNITDDILNGNYSQAAYRTVQGAVSSASSLALALVPGGIVAIGAGTASQKQEDLEAEGEDIGIKTALNATINGVAEGFFEKYTAGIGKSVYKSFAGGTKEAAEEFSKGIFTTILKDVGIEGGSEFATSVTQDLSDKLVQGKDINLLQISKNAVDAALIGGLMGGTISTPKALNGYIAAKTINTETKKEIDGKTLESNSLKAELENPEISEDVKPLIQEKIDQLNKEVEALTKKEVSRAEKMPDADVVSVLQIDSEINELAEKSLKVVEDKNLSEGVKETLLKDNAKKYEELKEKKKELSKVKESDVIPASEVETKPETAVEETTETNPEVQTPEPVKETTTPEETVEGVKPVQEKPTFTKREQQEKVNSDQDDATLEKRMQELEDNKDPKAKEEFNKLETELEKREWDAVMNSPLEQVDAVVDGLIKKDKEMPNGFGSFMEMPDARQTKALAKKYKDAGNLKEIELVNDFKDALFGRPTKWYADGVKLRESANELAKRGYTFESLIEKVKTEFKNDGFDEATAIKAVKNMLAPIFKGATKQEAAPKPKEIASPQPVENKLSEDQSKQNALVNAKNEYNRLSASKKKGPQGVNLKQSVIQLAGDLGFKVSEKSNKLSVKNSKNKEAGKISFKEQIPEAKQDDINFALQEINNGVLLWNGDPLSPRVDLGISRADIRKGEADIKKGNPNTVPAKRLIEALRQAKENGGYEFIEGSGGKINRISVPLNTPQSEEALTQAEQNEIAARENELVDKYDNWFNSLDLDTQNEILGNYEKTDDSGTPGANPEGRESKKNVLNGKKGKGKEKEKIESEIYKESKWDYKKKKDVTEEVVVYHGTGTNFDKFDSSKSSEATRYGKGISFVDGKGVATRYSVERQDLDSEDAANDSKAIVKEAKLTIQKPFDERSGGIDTSTPEAKKLIEIVSKRFDLSPKLVENLLSGNGKKSAFPALSEVIFDPKKDESTFMFTGNTEKTRKLLQEAGYDSVIGQYEDATEYFVFDAKNVVPAKPTGKVNIAADMRLDDLVSSLEKISNNLDQFGKENLGMNLPVAVAKVVIDTMKLAAKTAKTTADVISAGINALKETSWYKNLSKEDQKDVTENFTSYLSKPFAKDPKQDFEKKPGKKSLLNRIYEGDNNSKLTELVEKSGLNYEIESQKLAQERAKKFVKEAGITKAREAVQNNLIKGAEKAFVQAEILDQLVAVSESASIKDQQRIAEDYQNIVDESLAFDNEAREAGRFISALQRIYNNSRLQYNLARQVEKYKAANNGVIDEETLTKFKEAEKKIKELEQKLKLAEEAREKAEAQQTIDDIAEAINRKKKTQNNRQAAKKLANKLRKAKIHRPDVFSSGVPASIVWDGAIETIAKAIEAGGSIADAVSKGVEYIKKTDWYKSITKEKQKQAVQSLREFANENLSEKSIPIAEDGKLKIPEQVLRGYVEQGITDIDQIAQKIIDEYFPDSDITIRQVRDAITQYGKTVNMSKDEISIEVRKLKRLGKLISSMEDVLTGKRPLKSGLQRDKLTQKEREMKRELNELMRELPEDNADLEKTWKNALDKVKSRLNNQIEDLNKQIANKEKRKIEKQSIKLDEEAKALVQRRNELRNALDELVGKPELTPEQKVKRSENALERAIENLTQQIADGNIEYKEKPSAITSAKIEALRESQRNLKAELQKMREESGLAEKKRLDQAKSRLKNQIKVYKRKLAEKDFSKKERVLLKEDAEIQEIKTELLKVKDVFDKARYEAELKNRTLKDYARETFIGLVNIPRILMAGGEMSMVFIQGGIQTVSLAVRNPKALAKIFAKSFVAIGSNTKTLEYEFAQKADPDYALMKDSKLSLTEADYKMELREETFIGNNLLYGLWNMIGKGIEFGAVKITGKNEIPTLGSTILSSIKKDIEQKRLPISEQWKNINPLLAFERGNTIYMNELRKRRFLDGVKKLKMEGKNEVDHKDDYKKLAAAVNTLTGRASIGRLEGVNDILSTIFFSFKNTVSTFNQLNPYYYYSLHSPNDPWNKVSVSQKMAMQDIVTFVGVTFSMMMLLQAAAGDDEDGEPMFNIETDPNASDFMKIKWGRTRFDPWHGMVPQVVFLSRLITGESKNDKGVRRIGQGYNADTHWDNFMRVYVENKFSPSMQIAFRAANAQVDKEGNKTYYGKPLIDYVELKPMYLTSLQEISKEDPNGWVMFMSALGFFGLNSQVYGDKPGKPKPKQQTVAY